MLTTFLVQHAAGCFLAVAGSNIRQSGWKYLRLMAIVSLCLVGLAGVLLMREANWSDGRMRMPAAGCLAAAAVLGVCWLFVNAAQNEHVRGGQRVFPALAGIVALAGACFFALYPSGLFESGRAASPPQVLLSTVLGALLLGTATAAMLLGHRYLTDTDMPIAPLQWLTRVYLGVFAARVVWVCIAILPVFSSSFRPIESHLYFWLAFSVRIGVGIVVAGVFAWMVWDCVRRRATQSATALFYLSMLLVFIGELAGQYLIHTEAMAL